MEAKIADLHAEQTKAVEAGGKYIQRHRDRGKLTARERIELLVDEGSAFLELMPLDSFVDAPLAWMDPVDQPGAILSVHADVLAACNKAEGREVRHRVIERHQFYAAAKKCFAVVQNSENRPYGCFILKKGVVFD